MSGVGCYMQINYSDGRSSRIELERLGKKGEGSAINGEIIAKQIKTLIEFGYTLESQSAGGTEVLCTTMVFIKKL
jgi:hypothetical protein